MLSISRFAPIAEVVASAADAQLAASPDTRAIEVVLDGDHEAEMLRQHKADAARTEQLVRYVVEEWAIERPQIEKFAVKFGQVALHLR